MPGKAKSKIPKVRKPVNCLVTTLRQKEGSFFIYLSKLPAEEGREFFIFKDKVRKKGKTNVKKNKDDHSISPGINAAGRYRAFQL